MERLSFMQITLGTVPVHLLPQKALFLPEDRVLVIADLHLGKAMHFRKAGILMPPASALRDYEVLTQLMDVYNPRHVWFLGDLFHSQANSEWRQFEAFIRMYPEVAFVLIRGNHDILPDHFFAGLNIFQVPHTLEAGPLLFSHEPMPLVPEGRINIAGHIHPGVSISRPGRQSYRLPCFYQSGQTLLLPAFGQLTGLYLMEKRSADAVFAVLGDQVLKV